MGELSQHFRWHEVGTLRKQLPVFSVVFLLHWLFFYSKNQKVLYALIIISFFSTSIPPLLERNKELSVTISETDNKLLTMVNTRTPEFSPNIYLLVYDAYVINETMLSYGIDNGTQEEYLEKLGFQIYPHTYSIGYHSNGSMSRVLNASTEYYGIARRGTSGDGVVQNLLKRFGYETYGIFPSDFFFRGTISTYDYTFPNYISAPKDLLMEAIFTGEFQFDIGFDDVSYEQFLDKKSNLFSTKTNFPKFVYAHSSKPKHSQNSGACRTNETTLFDNRLLQANLEMGQDMQAILEYDPDAIIIVAGDHGPYLTKTCYITSGFYDLDEISRLDIQDRYGSFLAIRWPTEDFEEYDDIVVLQDLFPAIFAYIFEDQKFLEAKVQPVLIGNILSGANVVDGIIEGGVHDGEPLFIEKNE